MMRQELERVFGSLGLLAREIGVSRVTPYGWFRKNGRGVPVHWRKVIAEKAAARGQTLDLPHAD